MSNTTTDWYLYCINEMVDAFGDVRYDHILFNWVMIHKFPLPDIFQEENSVLVITTPQDNISNHEGYDFYTDKYLCRKDGQSGVRLHDEDEYNPYAALNYSRLSFHLNSFCPKYPFYAGDRLIDIVRSVYHFLGSDW